MQHRHARKAAREGLTRRASGRVRIPRESLSRIRTSSRSGHGKRQRGGPLLIRNRIPWIAGIAGAVLLAGITLAGFHFIPLWAAPKAVPTIAASAVSWDGIPLGTIQDGKAFVDAYERWRTDYEQTAGMELAKEDALTVLPLRVTQEYDFSDTGSLLHEVKSYTDKHFDASVLYVNGHGTLAMSDPAQIREVLETLMDRDASSLLTLLSTQEEPLSVLPACERSFAETIDVRTQALPANEIVSVEEALEILSGETDAAACTYTVVQGDTLQQIAAKYNTTPEALLAANPAVASSDLIVSGQVLQISQSSRPLNVVTVLTRTDTETVAYHTKKTNDASLLKGKTVTDQKGENGEQRVTRELVYRNGTFVSESVTETVVLKEPVEEIVRVGTMLPASQRRFPFPVSGYRISSYFGMRSTGMHYGIDLAVPEGTPVYAADAGTVYYSGNASGYGLVVYLNHSGGFQTRYGHCSRLLVQSGETVTKGQLIAYSGNTGRSTGPHVHFEIRLNGVAVDPQKYK